MARMSKGTAAQQAAVKDWYTAQELAGLPGMPGSEYGVRKWVEKNLTASRTKARGKGLEYALKCLPAETQAHLVKVAVDAVLASVPEPVPGTALALATAQPGTQLATQGGTALALRPTRDSRMTRQFKRPMAAPMDEIPFDGSSQADRDQALAIENVLRWVKETAELGRLTEKAAAHTLLNAARAGLLPEVKLYSLRAARDKRGRASADGLPSVRSIEMWLQFKRQGLSLVPQKPQPDLTVHRWHSVALAYKRRPQKPTNRMVWEQLVAAWQPLWGAKPPSYDQVNYFFREKYSATDLLRGQHLGSALSAKTAYQRRTSEGVPPFTECHADGWGTHFTAPHPTNGDFVTLEVWHFHELSTRFVTKPSIGTSESMAVILLGLENYIRQCGVPAIWQTDSTGAVKNKAVELDPLVGLAARVGITIVHPVKVGNSQANGIAENWNTWIDRESRELATYQHPRMDSLAHKRVRKLTDKMVKAAKAGDADSAQAHKREAERHGKGLVFESFAHAQAWIEGKVDKFNNAPHSSLPKVTCPTTGQRRHQTPAEAMAAALAAGFAPMLMSEAHLADTFKLHTRRTVVRGKVGSGFTRNKYVHEALADYKGEVVVVEDVMDGSRVWVKDLNGHLICVAPVEQISGYRALSVYEDSLEKRMNKQLKRLADKADVVVERMAPDAIDVHTVDVTALDMGSVLSAQVLPTPAAQTAPATPIPLPDYPDAPQRLSEQDQRDNLAKLLGVWDYGDGTSGNANEEGGARKAM